MVVITRTFGLGIFGLQTEGLVPMADMMNHKRPCDTVWDWDNTKAAFVIETKRLFNP